MAEHLILLDTCKSVMRAVKSLFKHSITELKFLKLKFLKMRHTYNVLVIASVSFLLGFFIFHFILYFSLFKNI